MALAYISKCFSVQCETLLMFAMWTSNSWILRYAIHLFLFFICPWEKNWPPWLLTVSSRWAHRELTVGSRWPKWSQPAVTEPWPGSWLSCDLAVTEPWSYWRCRDWAVTSPWLSCDLAVTELWPRRDWAVTSPSRDSAVIIGPRSRDHRGHRELTVSSRWPFIFSWVWDLFRKISCQFNTLEAKCVSRVN